MKRRMPIACLLSACRRQTCGTHAGPNSAAGRRGRRRSAYEAPRAAADGGTRLGGAESKRRRRPRLPAPPSRVTLLGLGRHEQKRRRPPGHRPFLAESVGRAAYFLMPCMVARSAFSAAASARADAASTRLAADSARLAASSARVAACFARVAVPLSSCAHPAPITVTSIRLATLAPIDRKRIPLPPCCWSPQPGARKIAILLSQKDRPSNPRPPSRLVVVVHVLAAGRRAGALLLLRLLGDRGLGGEEQAGDAGGVLERAAHHLGGVDDARLQERLVGLGNRVEAEVVLARAHAGQHDRGLVPGVGGDLPERLLHRGTHHRHALGTLALELEALQRLLRAQQGDAAARDDTLLDRRARGVHGVLDARLLLLH